jgi:hypothetical protein
VEERVRWTAQEIIGGWITCRELQMPLLLIHINQLKEGYITKKNWKGEVDTNTLALLSTVINKPLGHF